MPISDMAAGDLCRACRQRLFLEYVVPAALRQLRSDPSAGELFDGELASVIARIPEPFWRAHPELRSEGRQCLLSVSPRLDDDIQREVGAFTSQV